MTSGISSTLVLSLLFSAAVARAQTTQNAPAKGDDQVGREFKAPVVERDYERRVVMMPMRDGAKLHAVILRPTGSEKSGEALPFLLWRIDQALARPGQDGLKFRETFSRHFHVTTSGNFSTPALICTMLELGIDRIMFAVDYPYASQISSRI